MVVKTISATVMLLLTVMLASTVMGVNMPLVALTACTDAEGAECEQFGGVTAFSKSLFSGAFVPFELISVLLTVAIIGAIAVARGRTVEETKAIADKQQRARKLAAANALGTGLPLTAAATAAPHDVRDGRDVTAVGGH
jgi:NADH-quinone oxidoreductase subunit J